MHKRTCKECGAEVTGPDKASVDATMKRHQRGKHPKKGKSE